MLERVHQEPDIRRRRLIYGFPQQVASLRDVAHDFLQRVLPAQPARAARAAARRLFHQRHAGRHADRPAARHHGGRIRPAAAVGDRFSGTGRSYFLTRLVRDVMFGEAALVSTDPRVERRIRWTHRGAYAARRAGAAAARRGLDQLAISATAQLIAEVHAATTRYAEQYDANSPSAAPADTDLPAVVPPLDTLREHARRLRRARPVDAGRADLRPVPGRQARRSPRPTPTSRALNRLLLPRLLSRLEARLQASMSNRRLPVSDAEGLSDPRPRRGRSTRSWSSNGSRPTSPATYPGEDDVAAARTRSCSMSTRCWASRCEAIPLNDALVAQARAVLTKEPLAQYSYNRILRSKRVLGIPVWSVAENGGPEAGRVFHYRSGKPLDTGVPGIFTWTGYHTRVPAVLPLVTQDLAEDTLGARPREARRGGDRCATPTGCAGTCSTCISTTTRGAGTRCWPTSRSSRSTSVQEGLDELSLLSGAGLAAARPDDVRSTRRRSSAGPAPTDAGGGAGAGSGPVARRRGSGQFAVVRSAHRADLHQNDAAWTSSAQAFGTDATGKPIDPAKRVDEHFKALHDWVNGTPEDSRRRWRSRSRRWRTIYTNFNQVANAPNQGQALVGMVGGGAASGAAARPAQQLQDLARTVPPAIAPMLQTVSTSAAQVTARGASQELSDAWRSKVVPLCETALNRYPLVARKQHRRADRRFRRPARPRRADRQVLRPVSEAVRRHDAAAVEVAVGGADAARPVAGLARSSSSAAAADPRRAVPDRCNGAAGEVSS